MTANTIKVFIKIRPLIAREKNENMSSQWHHTGQSLKSIDKQYDMNFDNIYDETKTTQELFNELALPIVTSAVKGYNGTIFAYGQTSSGKTYTMMGSEENPGIIPLAVREIFNQIKSEDREFLIRIGYIEIYNEKIFDLLDEKRLEITKIYESDSGEVRVNQVEMVATSEEQILEKYEQGNRSRKTGETNMNDHSSRSHTIFRITIESREVGKTLDETAVQVSNLNLVDLAGSERANQTKADGVRLTEGGHINKSLLALGNVIRALSDDTTGPTTHINFRDSKLTRILSASLGGNAMTSIICTITPAALDETFSTLVFAQNAKKIKNKPKLNEVVSDQVMMLRMAREIQALKKKLEECTRRSATTAEFQIEKLQEQINEREGQFLHFYSVGPSKENRRRTWCSSSVTSYPPLLPAPAIQEESPIVPPFLVRPTERNSEEMKADFDDDDFKPGEEFNLDRTLSPNGRNTEVLCQVIKTPREMGRNKSTFGSPNFQNLIPNEDLKVQNARLEERIKELEEDYRELNDFKKVETIAAEDHNKLSTKLSKAKDRISVYELKIEELEEKMKEFVKDRDMERKTAEDVLSSAQYEHEVFREKVRNRELELVEKICELERKQDSKKICCDSLTTPSSEDSLISELQQKLQSKTEDFERIQQKLKELSRLQSENEELSNQLMDSIQENEKLTKQIETREAQKHQLDVITANYKLIDDIARSVENNEELPELSSNGDLVEPIIKLYQAIADTKTFILELQDENCKLNNENNFLKSSKLPTIQESFTECENELKDKLDSTVLELQQVKSELVEETFKVKESADEMQKLRYELEETKKESQRLNEEILKQQSKEFQDVSENELKDKLDLTVLELQQVKSELVEETFKVKESADEMQKLRYELEETRKESQRLNEEILKQQSHEFRDVSELQAEEKELDFKMKEIPDLRLSFEAESNANLLLHQELQEKSQKVTELEEEVTKSFHLRNEMASEIAELKEGLQRVMSLGEENERLKQVEKEHKQQINDLSYRMEEFHIKSEELKAAKGLVEVNARRIQELEKNEVNLKRQFELLKTEAAENLETITRLKTDNEILSDKSKRVEADLNQQNSDLLQENIRNLEIISQLETDKELLTEKTESLKKIEEEFSQLKQSTLDAEITINKLQADLEANDKEFEVFKTELDTMAKENEILKNELKIKEQELERNFEENSSKFDAENKILKSKLLTAEKEIGIFQKQLKERIDECEELKTHSRRRSSDNYRKLTILETEKNQLMQEIGAVQAEKVHVELELQKLQAQVSDLNAVKKQCNDLKHICNDNDLKYAVLDEKHSLLREENEKLESAIRELNDQMIRSDVTTVEQENTNLKQQNSELTTENFISAQIVTKLKEEVECLKRQQTITARKPPTSPESRAESDLYVSPKQQMLLEGTRATPARSTIQNEERQNRRKNVHDQRRRLSVWEQFCDSEAQTEAVSEICACSELTKKVKELQIEIRKRDCKLSSMERLAKHNPLKIDLDEAKKLLAREQRDHYHTKTALESMTRSVSKLEEKVAVLSKNQILLKETAETTTQAVDESMVQKSKYDEMETKVIELERQLRQRQKRIVELQNTALNTAGKENVSSNINKTSEMSRIENENLSLKMKMQEIERKLSEVQTDDVKASMKLENEKNKLEIEKMREDMEKLQKKYDNTRRLCNLRNDDIEKRNTEIQFLQDRFVEMHKTIETLNSDNSKLRDKYEKVKEICEIRLQKINALRTSRDETMEA